MVENEGYRIEAVARSVGSSLPRGLVWPTCISADPVAAVFLVWHCSQLRDVPGYHTRHTSSTVQRDDNHILLVANNRSSARCCRTLTTSGSQSLWFDADLLSVVVVDPHAFDVSVASIPVSERLVVLSTSCGRLAAHEQYVERNSHQIRATTAQTATP